MDFVVVFVSPFQTNTTRVSHAESSLLPAASFTGRSLTVHYSLPLSACRSLFCLFLYFCWYFIYLEGTEASRSSRPWSPFFFAGPVVPDDSKRRSASNARNSFFLDCWTPEGWKHRDPPKRPELLAQQHRWEPQYSLEAFPFLSELDPLDIAYMWQGSDRSVFLPQSK